MNKPGGSINDMMVINDLIQHLDLIDVPFEGMSYTSSNMQDDPLLEKFDWVFVSASLSLSFPATQVQTLSRAISDHPSNSLIIGTAIPKSSMFILKTIGLILKFLLILLICTGTTILFMIIWLALFLENLSS